jgi:hypothetical protein
MTDVDGRSPRGWDWRDGFDTDPLALDNDTAERMLRGTVAPDDAPPGYSRVSEMVAALTATPTADETAWHRFGYPVVTPPRANGATLTATRTQTRRARVHTRRLRVMTATLVSSVVVFGSLAAAGALPSRAQQITSDVLGQIGVSVPAPESHANSPAVDASGNDTSSNSTTGADSAAHHGSSSDATSADATKSGSSATVPPVTSGTVPKAPKPTTAPTTKAPDPKTPKHPGPAEEEQPKP